LNLDPILDIETIDSVTRRDGKIDFFIKKIRLIDAGVEYDLGYFFDSVDEVDAFFETAKEVIAALAAERKAYSENNRPSLLIDLKFPMFSNKEELELIKKHKEFLATIDELTDAEIKKLAADLTDNEQIYICNETISLRNPPNVGWAVAECEKIK